MQTSWATRMWSPRPAASSSQMASMRMASGRMLAPTSSVVDIPTEGVEAEANAGACQIAEETDVRSKPLVEMADDNPFQVGPGFFEDARDLKGGFLAGSAVGDYRRTGSLLGGGGRLEHPLLGRIHRRGRHPDLTDHSRLDGGTVDADCEIGDHFLGDALDRP